MNLSSFDGLAVAMFNFLFEGKIGDILAPVVPSNQLFLAIQHFKNAELNNLLNSTGYNPAALADGGYAAIHVACRYNNRAALDILLSRGKWIFLWMCNSYFCLMLMIIGTNIQLADQNGDTPLHYAAKYGHLDLCKFLIERGAAVHARNRNKQSPYDLAESHLVRQYLLPLQLAAERGMPEFQTTQSFGSMGGVAYPPSAGSIATNVPSIPPPAYAPPATVQYGVQSQLPPSTAVPPVLVPPPAVASVTIPPAPAATFSNSSPPLVHTPSTQSPGMGASIPPQAPPSYSFSGTVTQNTRPTNTRLIQPGNIQMKIIH